MYKLVGPTWTESGGNVSDLVFACNCSVARMLPGEAALVSEWTGLQGRAKNVKRFERSNVPDTALNKNYLYLEQSSLRFGRGKCLCRSCMPTVASYETPHDYSDQMDSHYACLRGRHKRLWQIQGDIVNMLYWPNSWTPAVGGLIMCEWDNMSPYCSAQDEWLIMKLCMYVGYHTSNNVSNFGVDTGDPITFKKR